MVADRFDDGTCVLSVGGVGYEVFAPLGTLARLPQPPETVTLHVHTHVREDALTLYGFESLHDREAFRSLIGISGIGPKMALAVLSVMDAKALGEAITVGDASRFRGIPGVGKKTSERIVLELKDKFRLLGGLGAPPSAASAGATLSGAGAPGAVVSPRGLVVQALVHMGYKLAEAERAVARVAQSSERDDAQDHASASAQDKPVELLLREALSVLA